MSFSTLSSSSCLRPSLQHQSLKSKVSSARLPKSHGHTAKRVFCMASSEDDGVVLAQRPTLQRPQPPVKEDKVPKDPEDERPRSGRAVPRGGGGDEDGERAAGRRGGRGGGRRGGRPGRDDGERKRFVIKKRSEVEAEAPSAQAAGGDVSSSVTRPPARPRDPDRQPRFQIIKKGDEGYGQGPPQREDSRGPPRTQGNNDQGGGGGAKGERNFRRPARESQGGRGGWSRGGGRGGGRGRGGRGGRNQFNDQVQSVQSRRKGREAKKERLAEKREAEKVEKQEILEVGEEGMPLRDLALALATTEAEVIKVLFMKGVMCSVTQTLDYDLVVMVATEMEVEVLKKEEGSVEDAAKKVVEFEDLEDLEHMQTRAPVVTIMGHVDHGKTSLLDAIRESRVAKAEAGGITQAIGAYEVETEVAGEMKSVTFLDTPGHEAFSAMRARGARVTDIAIIIVAADDGVKPQTVEAIKHAQAAGVPTIVAINKIDKEGANVERVKSMLAEVELLPEEWGGSTPCIGVSAHTRQGIDDLLETILLVAEVEELEANPDRAAAGTVIESHLDKNRGPTATLLVQAGTLRVGDAVLCGDTFGKVRALEGSFGNLETAGPSTPVSVLGLSGIPQAGDTFEVCSSDSEARKKAEDVAEQRRSDRLAEQAGGGSKVTLSNLTTDWNDEDQGLQKLNIILKADTSGSVEAIKAALSALPQTKVALRFLLASAGEVSVSDIDLADASEGIVFGFNNTVPEAVLAHAQQRGVEVRSYNVIYDLIDEVTAAMEGLLSPVMARETIGEAEVRAVFGTGSTRIAGCLVTEGKITLGATLQVTRHKGATTESKLETVYEGDITSLRRIKDSVKEVERGLECGIAIKDFADWKDGDKILAYRMVEKMQTLEAASAPPKKEPVEATS